MSNEYIIDSDENSDYMYDKIKKIIDTCGPRAPCSEAERKASELVAADIKDYCDSVELEEFTTYPRAFLGWIRLALGFWFLSFLLFLISPINPLIFSILCLGIGFFILFIIYKQFLNYEEWTPKIFPYKEGTSQNVVGVIKPSGEVKKRVVYSGHIDSAFRFNLIQYTRQGYAYFLIGGIVALLAFLIIYIVQLVYAILAIELVILTLLLTFLVMALPLLFAFVFLVLGKSDKVLFGAFSKITPFAQVLIIIVTIYSIIIDILLWNFLFVESEINLWKTSILLVLISIPSFVALFFFAGKKATPGAIDNLTAVAPCMCIAKVLKDWKDKHPNLVPKNTEVVISIVGCEEIGLRGAYAFAVKHQEEYNKIDTTCVNLESLTETAYQGIFTRENTTRTDLSPEVYNLLVESCKDLGYDYKLEEMPGIAGGTDAAGLVKGGLKAASLIGLKYKDYLSYYHTDRDHYTLINKERKPMEDQGTDHTTRNVRGAMEMALKICLKYLEKKDKE